MRLFPSSLHDGTFYLMPRIMAPDGIANEQTPPESWFDKYILESDNMTLNPWHGSEIPIQVNNSIFLIGYDKPPTPRSFFEAYMVYIITGLIGLVTILVVIIAKLRSRKEVSADTSTAAGATESTAPSIHELSVKPLSKPPTPLASTSSLKESRSLDVPLAVERSHSSDYIASTGSLNSVASDQSLSRKTSAMDVRQFDRLTVDHSRVLGHGSHGTIVFYGSFEGHPVAVKRIVQHQFDHASTEVSSSGLFV